MRLLAFSIMIAYILTLGLVATSSNNIKTTVEKCE